MGAFIRRISNYGVDAKHVAHAKKETNICDEKTSQNGTRKTISAIITTLKRQKSAVIWML
jgi:hypothetical protein